MSDNDDDGVFEALVNWCDDKMRAIAIMEEPLPTPDSTWHVEALKENYKAFQEELQEEQSIELDEEANPRDDWLLIGEDYLRVYHMYAQFKDEDGNHTKWFNRKKHCKESMGKLCTATHEHFQEWLFNLSWDMAKLLQDHKLKSDESSDSDDEDEEEGEEEDSSEEEEEDSSEGSGGSDSNSDSDGVGHTTNGTHPANKKQKTDKK